MIPGLASGKNRNSILSLRLWTLTALTLIAWFFLSPSGTEVTVATSEHSVEHSGIMSQVTCQRSSMHSEEKEILSKHQMTIHLARYFRFYCAFFFFFSFGEIFSDLADNRREQTWHHLAKHLSKCLSGSWWARSSVMASVSDRWKGLIMSCVAAYR